MRILTEEQLHNEVYNTVLKSLTEQKKPVWLNPYSSMKAYNLYSNIKKSIKEIKPYEWINQLLLSRFPIVNTGVKIGAALWATFKQVVAMNTPEEIEKQKNNCFYKPTINLAGQTSQAKCYYTVPRGTTYINKKNDFWKSLSADRKQWLENQIDDINSGEKRLNREYYNDSEIAMIKSFTKTTTRNLIREYPLFNIDQINGLSEDFVKEQKDKWIEFNRSSHWYDLDKDKIIKGDALIKIYLEENPEIEQLIMSDVPKYQWQEDRSNSIENRKLILPLREVNTVSDSAYYSTVFHEIIHSTKHNLKFSDPLRTSMNEEQEELVAEIGSYLLMSYLGISTEETIKNSDAYCASWGGKLQKMNPQKVIQAIECAFKAYENVKNTYEKVISKSDFDFDKFFSNDKEKHKTEMQR